MDIWIGLIGVIIGAGISSFTTWKIGEQTQNMEKNKRKAEYLSDTLRIINTGYNELINEKKKLSPIDKFNLYHKIIQQYDCFFQFKTEEYVLTHLGSDIKDLVLNTIKQNSDTEYTLHDLDVMFTDKRNLSNYFYEVELAFIREIENLNNQIRGLYDIKQPKPITRESLMSPESNSR